TRYDSGLRAGFGLQSTEKYPRPHRRQVSSADSGASGVTVPSATTRLTAIETHSICVLLSIAFGRGTMQGRIFARHVNAVRRKLGLPQITQAAAGNPTTEE